MFKAESVRWGTYGHIFFDFVWGGFPLNREGKSRTQKKTDPHRHIAIGFYRLPANGFGLTVQLVSCML